MPADWDALLLTFLHDPPGKALAIMDHEARAARLAKIALGVATDRRALHDYTRTEDIIASTIERVVPLPTAGAGGERAVGVEEGRLHVVHPLSGRAEPISVSDLAADPDAEQQTLAAIVDALDPPRARALAVWRLWRERLAERHSAWGRLPADTRLPDHTIWNHLDAAMGCAGSTGQEGVALLLFSLGPVQPFIASARTVRDLWAGSYLLAWLTFAAMRPILHECGPGAVLSPSLRGNPLMDQWLRQLKFEESPGSPHLLQSRINEPPSDQLLSPCLPNRFSAFVPWGRGGEKARDLAKQCEKACRAAWKEVSDKVRKCFGERLNQGQVPHAAGWDRLWDAQVNTFFEVRTAVLPRNECSDEVLGRLLSEADSLRLEEARDFRGAIAVRALEQRIPAADRPGYDQGSAGRWMAHVDLLGRLMAAQRTLRPLPWDEAAMTPYDPPPDGEGRWPGKCSLLGTYEQLGPAERAQAEAFWDGVARDARIEGAAVRKGERLCAVSLVKRYAWGAYFTRELNLPADRLRYPDTATVAARLWLENAKINPDDWKDWSGQWLHWSQPNQGKDEGEEDVPGRLWDLILEARRETKTPAYYAILMLDGDRMGQWLRGGLTPSVRKALHPRLVNYFQELPGTEEGLAARRPFGPTLHAALSEALTNFALHFVGAIVKEHRGTLIYAGGDDVLALLPTENALACACKLNDTYRQDWAQDEKGRERLLMGCEATASAGLAVVHYKEDLRAALQAAREAEKQAKNAGRDALCVRLVRRSGEDSSAVVGWVQVETLQHLVLHFRDGASDRWAYRLRAELPGFVGLPEPAFRGELVRLLKRLEAGTQQFRDRVAQLWDGYRQRWGEGPPAREAFVTLCQSASFLARGREQR